MKTKFIIAVFLVILFSAHTIYATTVNVSGFKALPQEQSNWCWAASIQSIFLTAGLEVSQANIVTAAYGTPVNQTAPGFDGTLHILNGLAVSIDGSVWKVSASAGNSFPNANWLYTKLQENIPVMIWYKDQFSNHSIIVHGGLFNRDYLNNINWQAIYAFDPWLNRNMTINASNIPLYVYGSFDIELTKNNDIESGDNNNCEQECDTGRNKCERDEDSEKRSCVSNLRDNSVYSCNCPNWPVGNFYCYDVCKQYSISVTNCIADVDLQCDDKNDECIDHCKEQ